MVAKVSRKTGVGNGTHFTFSTPDSTDATVVHRVELLQKGYAIQRCVTAKTLVDSDC